MTRVSLSSILQPTKNTRWVVDPSQEKLISVKLHGGGAVERSVGDGKSPKPFMANVGKAGQFVFSRIWARRGAMALIPASLDGVVVTNEFPLFDIDESRIFPHYLSHLTRSADFVATVAAKSAGASGQNRVREKDFLSLLVELPPLDEQRRIAAILDKADMLRDLLERQIDEYSALRRSIIEDSLRKTTTQSVPASLAMPYMRNGLSASTRGQEPGQVLTLSAVTSGHYDNSFKKDVLFDKAPSPGQYVTSDDLLISRGNGNVDLVGVGVVPPHTTSNVVFPDTIIAGRIDKEVVVPRFLEAIWSSRRVRAQVRSAARTTNGTFKVNQSSLRAIMLDLPSLDEQLQVVARLDQVAESKSRTEASSVLLDELFRSLQSRAFRGEL